MPNYNLVSNAVFTPFSYERYLQPYEANEKDFREIQEAVANYDDLTSSWRDKLDSSVQDQYDNYYKALESGRDRLIKEGLTSGSRNLLMNIRRGYAKEITPIENAYKLKQEAVKRQQDSFDKSEGMMVFTKDARNTQLADYMHGNVPEYQETNLNSVMNEGLAGAKAISSRYFNSEERRRFSGDYNDLITKQGLNPQEALQVIADLKDDSGNPKYPEFSKLLNDIKDKHGYSNYSQEDQNKIMGAALSGINMGIAYGEKEQLYENWRVKLTVENAYKLAQANQQAGADALYRGNIPINILDLVPPNQEGEAGRTQAENLRKALGFSTDFKKRAKSVNITEVLALPGVEGNSTYTPKNKDGSSKFEWFDSKGNLLTKGVFKDQGMNEGDKLALSQIYDKMFPKLRSFNRSNIINSKDISSNLIDLNEGRGAYRHAMVELPIQNREKSLENIVSKLSSGDYTDIQEVESIDKEGQSLYTGRRTKVSDFLDANGKALFKPTFMTGLSEKDDSFYFRFNGKLYAIPKYKLGSIATETVSGDIQLLREIQEKKQNMLDTYGEYAYYNSKIASKLEKALDAAGANYVRKAVNALSFEYKVPTYDMNDNNESRVN
jgi:hypothetical protein